MMWKIIILGCLVSVTVAQLDMRSMMMMQMMNGMNGGGNSNSNSNRNSNRGTSGSDNSGGMDSMLRCTNTENLRLVPCRNTGNMDICSLISMQTYNMPNMLECSALGIGCCVRDLSAVMMMRTNAK